jgi:Sigma-70, region 4
MMSRLDDLPPDQRAALSLLLRQGKSYGEVAELLGIQESAVRDRAHAALATLAGGDSPAPGSHEPSASRREDIGDYLLGQQTSPAARHATRAYLDDSPEGRAWAAAVAAEISPLAGGSLPEVPDGAVQVAPDSRARGAQPPSTGAQRASADVGQVPGGAGHSRGDTQPAQASDGASGPSRLRVPRSLPSSRRGGALLLGVIAAAAIVAIILAVSGGGSGSHSGSTTAASAARSSGSKASTTSTGPTVNGRFTLAPTEPASKAIGVVETLSEGNKHAFYIAAAHLPASKGFFYAIWLYNSPTSHQALSRSPPVSSNGRLEGGALLPANAGEFHRMLVTRETSERPSHPGPVVLSGPFSLTG